MNFEKKTSKSNSWFPLNHYQNIYVCSNRSTGLKLSIDSSNKDTARAYEMTHSSIIKVFSDIMDKKVIENLRTLTEKKNYNEHDSVTVKISMYFTNICIKGSVFNFW